MTNGAVRNATAPSFGFAVFVLSTGVNIFGQLSDGLMFDKIGSGQRNTEFVFYVCHYAGQIK